MLNLGAQCENVFTFAFLEVTSVARGIMGGPDFSRAVGAESQLSARLEVGPSSPTKLQSKVLVNLSLLPGDPD